MGSWVMGGGGFGLGGGQAGWMGTEKRSLCENPKKKKLGGGGGRVGGGGGRCSGSGVRLDVNGEVKLL